jgi:HPt (histidine-containing phosphotransfer) domain-containing protein
MTAHALQGDREHYLAQGMDDYVSKPVKLQDLVNVLTKAAQQRQTPLDEEMDTLPTDTPDTLPAPSTPAAAPPPPKETFPLDVAVLEQFLGEIRSLAPQLADELIDTLLQETPRTLRVMRQAVDQSDAETLYNAAHGFKPHCTQFGAMTMMMLCQELETISRSGTLSGALERVEQLEQEYALVKEALETMRAKQ